MKKDVQTLQQEVNRAYARYYDAVDQANGRDVATYGRLVDRLSIALDEALATRV